MSTEPTPSPSSPAPPPPVPPARELSIVQDILKRPLFLLMDLKTGPVIKTVLQLLVVSFICLGVFGAVTLAARLKIAQLPAGVTRAQLYGGCILCGIGFTMSLFIGDLAFRASPRGDEVKLAVFVGSLISAVVGLIVLALATRRR